LPNKLIPPTKGFGYSDFYLDFLAGRESARRFFVSGSNGQAAEKIDAADYKRSEVAEILRRQNSEFGASGEVLANIDRLRDGGTLCVFGGQQAGLFGGPMMTLVKALGIVKLARSYSTQLSRPVIPIFWIAADDHDFEEVNHTWLLDRESEIRRIAYETTLSTTPPMGELKFADANALESAKSQFKECLGQSEFTSGLFEQINRCYSPDETFATAFGKLFAAMTRDTGLVLFNPYDDEVRRLARPLYQHTLSQQAQIHFVVNEANARLTAAGYHLQVQKHDEATHLFMNEHGSRKPVYRDSGYRVGERIVSTDELEGLLEREPQRFSPDVLLRPVLQSYLFPVVGQTGGPSEIAYFAQMNSLFELMGVPAPYCTPRPTVTLVEKRYEKIMSENKICFTDLTGDIEQVVNRIMAATFPKDVENSFEQLRADIFSRFDTFNREALAFDPSLEEFARQTAGKIDFALKAFEGKVFSSHKKKSKDERDRIYRLSRTLFPNHGLQERTINFAYFLARYGDGIVPFLLNQMDAEQTAHQLISLSEYTT
jgi:bacillithiol biosynthesis cysteine-adding enzyme BshC